MKIFYSPSYNGFVYRDFSKQSLFFDSLICNTQSLLNLLELHAGLHIQIKEDFERIMDYTKAMKAAFKKNPSNIFINSFNIDMFNTAKECLKWRDALAFAQWNPKKEKGSPRLNSLAEIEEEFSSISFYEKIFILIKEIEQGCPLPKNLEVITPFDFSCFHPSVKKLFASLQKRQIPISTFDCSGSKSNKLKKIADILINNKPDNITLDDSDGSFEILSFKEKNEALRYLSLSRDTYDVWINRDNRSLDYYLNSINKATCGSEDSGVTAITALPLLGISCFEKPINLFSLINWLSSPVNPIKLDIRKKLIKAITSSGGYFCDECKTIINSADEESQKQIKLFLPDINDAKKFTSDDNTIKVSEVQDFLKNLSDWLIKYIKSQSFSVSKKDQLMSALETCRKMKMILSNIEKEEVDYSQLFLAFDSLSLECKTSVTESIAGSFNLIKSSAMFASPAKKTIWCDFYNPEEENLTYDFLSPAEKEIFSGRFWEDADEKTFNRFNKYLPFLYTEEKLTLVTVEKEGTKDVVKEALLIRIKENMGKAKDTDGNEYDLIDDYLIHKKIEDMTESVVLKESKNIQNRRQDADGTIKFNRENIDIKFRQNESFSALSELIFNPFDYMFKYILKLEQSGGQALNALYTTKGLVAHSLIEKIFDPKKGPKATDIRERIKSDFYKLLEEAVLENGEILLNNENKTEYLIFRKNMEDCVNQLCEFIDLNQLEVEECEQRHSNVSIEEFKEININLGGSIDMLLKDKQGLPVIFDFKYSSNFEKYKGWIEDNKALQLAIYKAFIINAKKLKSSVKIRSAFILLPDVRVITGDNFEGNIIKAHGQPDKILEKTAHSYAFRKDQIEKGILEDGEGIDSNNLDYVIKTSNNECSMIELNIEKHSRSAITQTKEVNEYSKYKFFKAGK